MTGARLAAAVVAVSLVGCGPQRVVSVPGPQALIVLLPDPDSGAAGRAIVSNQYGTVDLATPLAATETGAAVAPSPPATMTEGQVATIFGAALDTLPPASQLFVLRFAFDSDVLTDESRTMFPAILQAVANRPAPEVVVVGHTDRSGNDEANRELGLKRATAVRALLIEAGFDASYIEVESHGESDPLVPTADNVEEPLNRRVEITVR
jgi:outer membrane protein OmpA-like peptidoglycan-associated protein